MLYEIAVFTNFAKFTGKRQCWDLFVKETSLPVFSCEFCKISKKAFFTKHFRAATSLSKHALLLNSCFLKNSIFTIKIMSFLTL